MSGLTLGHWRSYFSLFIHEKPEFGRALIGGYDCQALKRPHRLGA